MSDVNVDGIAALAERLVLDAMDARALTFCPEELSILPQAVPAAIRMSSDSPACAVRLLDACCQPETQQAETLRRGVAGWIRDLVQFHPKRAGEAVSQFLLRTEPAGGFADWVEDMSDKVFETADDDDTVWRTHPGIAALALARASYEKENTPAVEWARDWLDRCLYAELETRVVEAPEQELVRSWFQRYGELAERPVLKPDHAPPQPDPRDWSIARADPPVRTREPPPAYGLWSSVLAPLRAKRGLRNQIRGKTMGGPLSIQLGSSPKKARIDPLCVVLADGSTGELPLLVAPVIDSFAQMTLHVSLKAFEELIGPADLLVEVLVDGEPHARFRVSPVGSREDELTLRGGIPGLVYGPLVVVDPRQLCGYASRRVEHQGAP